MDNACGGQLAIPKQSGLSTSLSDVGGEIDMLGERIGMLANRLEGIMDMTQAPKEPTSCVDSVKPSVIAIIDSHSYRIKGLKVAIDEIIDRLVI